MLFCSVLVNWYSLTQVIRTYLVYNDYQVYKGDRTYDLLDNYDDAENEENIAYRIHGEGTPVLDGEEPRQTRVRLLSQPSARDARALRVRRFLFLPKWMESE